MKFIIKTPRLFDFNECLVYLGRSELECLHTVEDNSIYKVLTLADQKVLIGISQEKEGSLTVEVLKGDIKRTTQNSLVDEINRWFDLHTDLDEVYEVLNKNTLLKPLIRSYKGLRIIGITDLFEAISWAIIGQQINLQFAYQVKQNLVLHAGDFIEYEGKRYYSFPKPQVILELSDEKLKEMKFSRQKIRYIKYAADKIYSGELDKYELDQLQPEDLKRELINLIGIGEWSANYVMMRCFLVGTSFPVQDAGLQQAVKKQLNLTVKPSKELLLALREQWQPWQAYATFYLWRSLY